MPVRLWTPLAGGGTLVALFVAAMLFSRRSENRRAELILMGLMILFALSIFYPLLFRVWPSLDRKHAPLHLEPFQFLIAPLMAWYFRALIVPERRIRPRLLLHLLPFAGVVLAGLVPPPSPDDGLVAGLAASARVVLWSLVAVQTFVYLIPSLTLVFRYRHSLRDQESNLEGLDLGWLMWFAHLFFGLSAGYVLLLIVMVRGPHPRDGREYLSVALTALVFAVGQRALVQRPTPIIEALQASGRRSPAKHQRASVPTAEAEEVKTRLVKAMEQERLFLEPNLRLSDLVDRLGASRNQISFVLNTCLGKSFYDFVNEYRVREVLRLIDEGSGSGLKITAIAFDAGFNSKPAFNAVFKKLTGLTPSQYRKQGEKESHPSRRDDGEGGLW